MNRKRAIGLTALGLALVAGVGLVGGAALVRSRMAGWVDEALKSALEADVSVGSVEISLLSSFPEVRIEARDVVVANRAPFEGVELARLPEVELGIDLWSALSSSGVRIEEVRVRKPRVHIVYATDGRANWDIFGEGEADEGAAYHLRLSEVEITDLDVLYEDEAGFLHTDILDVDVLARADLTQEMVKVQTKGAIESLTVRYAGLTWLQATKWKTQMKVDYDQTSGAIRFGENEITVNALPLAFSGLVEPRGDDWFLDVDYEATDTSFQSLLSLVPDAYDDGFAGLDAAGSVSLSGSVDGIYSSTGDDLPGFTMDLEIRDGRFEYPDLPSSVDAVSASIAITHPEGVADLVVIDAKRFALTVAGATLTGHARVEHPSTDPDVDIGLDGRVDLGKLRSAIPGTGDAPAVDGLLDLDCAIRGRMSNFEAKKLDAVSASGTIRGRGLAFTYEEQPMEIRRLDLGLSPARADLGAFDLVFGRSDLSLVGGVDNLIPWSLSDGVLGGAMTLTSNRLDLRALESEDEEVDPDEPALVAVPEDVDATLDLQIGTLRTKEFTMESVSGSVGVKDGTLTMRGLRAGMYGGRVTLDGAYRAPTTDKADLDVGIAADRLDITRTLASIETLALIAPVLSRATGQFNSGISVKTTLARDGSPDLSILSSVGDLVPVGMQIHSETLANAASQLRDDKLGKLTLDGTRVFYALKDGRVDVKPFTAKLGPQPATIQGRFGPLDRMLDLVIGLPIDPKALGGTPLAAGLGAKLPKTADVEIRIGGTMDKPKVSVALKGAGEVVDALLDPLIAKATAEGDALLAKARAAADKLIAQGDKAAQKLLDEAAKKAKNARKEAKGNPLKEAAADAAAKLIEKEGDKAAKAAKRAARDEADKLVADAQKERDKLIAEATAKAVGR